MIREPLRPSATFWSDSASREQTFFDAFTATALDRLLRLTTTCLHASGAVLGLVEATASGVQHWRGFPALPAETQDLAFLEAFCRPIISSRQPCIIPESTSSSEAFPTREHTSYQAYLGYPLLFSGGRLLGILCLLDVQPHAWHTADLAMLHDLTSCTLDSIAFHRREHDITGFLENDVIALSIIDDTGIILWANQAELDLLGYVQAEYIGHHIAEFHVDSFEDFLRYLQTKTSFHNYEVCLRCKNGALREVVISANVVKHGIRLYSYCFTRDVTARKQEEERLRHVIEAAPTGLIMVDQTGIMVMVNTQTAKLFGYSKADLRGKPIEILVPERFHAQHPAHRTTFFANPQTRAMGGGRDLYGRRQDNSEFPVEIGLNPLSMPDGTFVVASVIDITERKSHEELTRKSLQEKEILLKEIHHRVKNNMQVISSLLELQGAYIDEPRYQSMFAECQHRVRSMALIHEHLYRSQNLSTLDFSEHLRELIAMLIHSYSPENIQVDIDAEAVMLDLDTAIPLGLILNELVSNVLKHAFPNGRSGTLTIQLHAQDQETLCLAVLDNGVGLPADLQWEKAQSLGLKMVRTLTRQIRGLLHVRCDGETEIAIHFPAPLTYSPKKEML